MTWRSPSATSGPSKQNEASKLPLETLTETIGESA
jgi:hypothetical protein